MKDQWRLKDKLIAIISFCLFVQLLISHPLWFNNDRHYPKIPAFENFQFAFVDNAKWYFFCLILLCLFSFTIRKAYRFTAALFILLILLFVLNDINRLQVWLYELTMMLFVLFITKNNKTKMTISVLQIMIICVYCWSGIQKLNIYFIEDTFPWLMEPFGLESFVIKNSFIAYFAAIIEILIGFGLLFKRTRQIAFTLAVGLHIIILIILSPFGHNWNHVVWPWNICMIVLLYLLFYKNEDTIFENAFENIRTFIPFPIILILFGIMPFFNFFGMWDEQLSFKMYSGISPEGIFYYHEQQTECIPSAVKKRFVHVTPGTKTQRIILDDWIFFDLKITPYKSKKRILQVAEKLCHCFEKPELAGLELLEVDRWNKEKDKITKISCLKLLRKQN